MPGQIKFETSQTIDSYQKAWSGIAPNKFSLVLEC